MADASDAASPKRRREKFDRLKKDEFLELLREGMRRGKAAGEVGVNRATVQRHMNRYPTFADEVSEAEMHADEEVEDALYQAAISGNVVAIQVWLYNRRPERWQDRRQARHQIEGPDGGPIAIKPDLSDLTVDELRALCALVDKSQSGTSSS